MSMAFLYETLLSPGPVFCKIFVNCFVHMTVVQCLSTVSGWSERNHDLPQTE